MPRARVNIIMGVIAPAASAVLAGALLVAFLTVWRLLDDVSSFAALAALTACGVVLGARLLSVCSDVHALTPLAFVTASLGVVASSPSGSPWALLTGSALMLWIAIFARGHACWWALAVTVAPTVLALTRYGGDDQQLAIIYAFQGVVLAGSLVVAGSLAVLRDQLRVGARLRDEQHQLRSVATALRHSAMTDALTGVANRGAFDDAVERLLHDRRRARGTFSLILLDLDHFKAFNDRHGHTEGDALLQRTAALWKSVIGARDVLARYGGEEFAVLMPDGDLHAATGLAARLRVAAPSPVTTSVGVAEYRPGDDGLTLIDRADEALYRAKAEGRDRVCVERAQPAAVPG